MAVDEKIVARVRKLLAVAAPTSGASQNEREMAALEAAKLIAEHGVVVGAEAPKKEKTRVVYRERRREPPPPGPTVMRTPFGQEYHVRYAPMPDRDWRRGIASSYGTCSDPSCNGSISPGDHVWLRQNGSQVQYLHDDGPCCW